MGRTLLVVLAWLWLGAPALAASSAWYEARTDHFRVILQGTPESAAAYATKLERFDKAMRVLRDMPEREGDRANPLVVFVVPDMGTVERLCRGGQGRKARVCDDVAGFFTPWIGQSVAFTPRRGSGDGELDLSAQAVLFHEYAHHFMFGNAAAAYPAWFTEGFAEFNAPTAFGKDGSVEVGRPPLYRAYSLVLGAQLPIRKLLTADGDTLQSEDRESLYARGWLLTHYLTFDKTRAGQLERYLELMNQGRTSLAAAESAFGDLGKLDADLGRYVGRGISYVVLKASDVAVAAPTVRALSPGEVAMLPVRWRSKRGVDTAEAAAVVLDARVRAGPYPSDPAVQDALAEAEYDAGHDDLAEAAADRALAADAKDRTAMMYKGRARLRRAVAAEKGETGAWKEARGWFVRANKLDPDDAQPLVLNYTSYLAAGVTPNANAVVGLERAFELSPQAGELRYLLARQDLIDDKPKEARAVLAPLAFDPHHGEGSLAAKLVAMIDAKDVAHAKAAVSAADAAEQADTGDGD